MSPIDVVGYKWPVSATWFALGLIAIVVGGLEFVFGRGRTIAAVVIGFGMGLATPHFMRLLA